MYLEKRNNYRNAGSPCGVVVNVLDCDIVVSEFDLQAPYYVHFWIITLVKAMNPLIPLAIY